MTHLPRSHNFTLFTDRKAPQDRNLCPNLVKNIKNWGGGGGGEKWPKNLAKGSSKTAQNP